MRRKLLFVITTFVLSLISSSQALAQDLRWTGKSLSEIADGNQGYFYLYNVGKKMFLSQGGLWGTSTEVSESGLLMQALVPVGDKYYVKTNLQMEGVNTANAGYLNFADSVDIMNDTGNFFLDQGTFPCGQWNITLVSGKVYTLSVNITGDRSPYKGKTYYLSAKPSSLEVVPTESVDDKYSQWMFVTLEEIKEDFKNADDASISNPTPSSFFFSDPGFYRKDLGISHWTITSSPIQLSTNETNKPLSSDGSEVSVDGNILPTKAISSQTTTYKYSVTCYYSSLYGSVPYHNVENITSTVPLHDLTIVGTSVTLTKKDDFIECGKTHRNGLAYQELTLSEKTSGTSGYTYYIGNGYILDRHDGTNLDRDLNASVEYWQSPYGKDWTANIHGQSGIIQQTISSGTDGWIPGWYKVTCKGFSTDGTGKLFAYSGTTRPNTENDKYQTKTFTNPTETPNTYVKASRLINDGTATFEQSVLVYVREGEDLTFGVEVEGGDVNSWTCFDSFTLGYCGRGELNLIIDETQTSIDYLNQQVDTKKNQTLRLKRDLNTGQWNSLVLPVNLNAEQVTTAFGGSTKLAKLKEARGNRIYFELVSLDDKEAKAIEAGQLYIINPQNPMKKGQPRMFHSQEMKTPWIEDYYTINQVSFTSQVDAKVEDNQIIEGATTDDPGMQMVGTYIYINNSDKQDHAIKANSYFLSNGHWMYTTSGVWSVKGLRAWIETGKYQTTSKNLIFNIDGVDEEEVSTGIDGLFVDGAETNTSISKTGVYSLSGQKISDKTNLPKGIYIVNGRKMIVK